MTGPKIPARSAPKPAAKAPAAAKPAAAPKPAAKTPARAEPDGMQVDPKIAFRKAQGRQQTTVEQFAKNQAAARKARHPAPRPVVRQSRSREEVARAQRESAAPDIARSLTTPDKMVPADAARLDVLHKLPKMNRAEVYQDVAMRADGRPGGMEAYAQQRYGAERGAEVHNELSALGKGFDQLAADPGLSSPTYLPKFTAFVEGARAGEGNGGKLADPWAAHAAFKDSLGTVDVFRAVKLDSPAIAGAITREGFGTRLERSAVERAAKGQPLPDMSEMDTKPMSDVMLHHVQPSTRMGGRLAGLTAAMTEGGAKPADARRAAQAQIEDEDFPQSITNDPGVGAAIASGNIERVTTGSAQARKAGDVYCFNLRMCPMDLIKQSDYLPAESKKAFPDSYQVNPPGGPPKRLPLDDGMESVVMSRIEPREILGFSKVAADEIPSIEPIYNDLPIAKPNFRKE